MAKILIKNAAVLTPEQYLPACDLAIEGNTITAVGSAPPTWQADRVIDGTGRLVTPGFVNTHTHAAMTLFRSYADDMPLMTWLKTKIWPIESQLTADDVYWGTMLSMVEMIRSGTTTFADMYFYMDSTARAAAEVGMRAVLARGLAGTSPTGQQALAESEQLYRDWQHGADGRITVMLGPHAPYTCPPAYLRQVADLAEKLTIPIHIHLSETAQEVADCQRQYGCSPVVLLQRVGLLQYPVLAAHCVHLNTADIALLQERQVSVAHNPGSNLKLASGIAPVPALLTAGVNVALGTDGAASNNNLDMLEEMRLTALIHKGQTGDPMAVPAQQALVMATVAGAQALHLPQVGRIAPGWRADVVLWDMQGAHWYPRTDQCSLLVYAAQPHDVHTVIIDGKIVLDDRELTTIDEEMVLCRAQGCAARLGAAIHNKGEETCMK